MGDSEATLFLTGDIHEKALIICETYFREAAEAGISFGSQVILSVHSMASCYPKVAADVFTIWPLTKLKAEGTGGPIYGAFTAHHHPATPNDAYFFLISEIKT